MDITPEYVEKLKAHVMELWNQRQDEQEKDTTTIETKISELRMTAKAIAEKIRYLSSEVAIKYMEEDLIKVEQEITQLENSKQEKSDQGKETQMDVVMDNVGYFLEHLEELLLHGQNPLKQAEYFSLLFEETPTYQDLLSGTPKLVRYLGLKPQFAAALVPDGDPTGNRTPITRMRTLRPSR